MMTEREAGAVVFRREGGRPLVLVVTAKDNSAYWLFPKGHIEPGESAEEAARREVEEESGIIAEVVETLGAIEYEFGGNAYIVDYFLLAYVSERDAFEGRIKSWLSPAEAETRLSFETTKSVLRRARPLIQTATE